MKKTSFILHHICFYYLLTAATEPIYGAVVVVDKGGEAAAADEEGGSIKAIEANSTLRMSIRFSTGRKSQSAGKFSLDELLSLKVDPKMISDDVDMDPCKAGSFIGDIAMPTQAYEAERNTVHNRRAKRAATARPERIWDYAVIPYEIDANFSGGHKSLFKQVHLLTFCLMHWSYILYRIYYNLFYLFLRVAATGDS